MSGGPWYYDVLAILGAAYVLSGMTAILIGRAIAIADRRDHPDLTGPPAAICPAGSESLRGPRVAPHIDWWLRR